MRRRQSANPNLEPTTEAVHLPFRDRAEAATILARRLAAMALGPEPLVLGIPRGGVVLAATVARALGAELDLIVAHKLGAPGNPEYAVGAVASDGTTIVEPWAEAERIDEQYLAAERDRQLEAARVRERRLRGGRPAPRIRGRVVVIVDDGIATGATVEVAALAARAAGAARVMVAVPVAAADSAARLRGAADEIISLATPRPFYAVGQWFARFDQVSDEEVEALLAESTT